MSDVVVDATPEEDQACAASPRQQASEERLRDVPENQESIEDQMNVKLTVSDGRKNMPTQPDVDFDEDEFTPHDYLFPAELRKKLNVAIIHDDADEDEARDLKAFIEKNVHLAFGRIRFKPRVELLSKVSVNNTVDPLDHALEVADFLFVYITRNFYEGKWSEFQAKSSLMAILSGHKNTQCSLVCVHTDQSLWDELPTKLLDANHLRYYQEKEELFKEDVIQYFHKISDRLLEDRNTLTKLRQKYVEAKPQILQMMNPETSIDRSKHPHEKERVTQPSKFSHDQSVSASKDRTKRPGKQTAPANVEERDSGASGNGASSKPINPQPHYR